MKMVRRWSCFLPVIILFLLNSCATTTTTSVWKDPAYQGYLGKILVMGISRRPAIQRFAEDEFVQQLRGRGVAAVPGYSVLPYGEKMGRDLVLARARRIGADAVLVIRPVGAKTQRTYMPGQAYAVPGPYRRWGSYYAYAYSPGYIVEDRYVYLETNVFDVTTEKLIWSAESETVLSGNSQELIKTFVGTTVSKLAADKLIP